MNLKVNQIADSVHKERRVRGGLPARVGGDQIAFSLCLSARSVYALPTYAIWGPDVFYPRYPC